MSSICSHFNKKNTQRPNGFSIFVTNKIFKTILTERHLIRYHVFINIYIVY